MSRTGKIARLPQAVREELNRRLRDAEPGGPLLEWLNALPEAKAVLAAQFAGQPISKQNLSEWRLGGFREWERHQEALAWVVRLAEQGDDLTEAADGADVSDRLASVLAGELALTAEALLAEATDPAQRWARLRELLPLLAELRRADHRAARLRLDREEQIRADEEREQQAHEAELERLKEEACVPLVAMQMLGPLAGAYGGGEAGRQAAALVLEIQHDLELGTLTRKAEPGPAGSNPVKPGQTTFPRKRPAGARVAGQKMEGGR